VTKTALLVDDSDETRAMYALRLRAEGYQVLEAADGAHGIELATARRPDLIFMNLSIPKIDGWSAIARLKREQDTREIPVVALSGFDEDTARARAEESGSDGFLGKPCAPSRLLEEVRIRLGPATPYPNGGTPA
jgi:CheY-like chemotaxis protein